MEFRAKDKLLQAVLNEPVLCKFGEYEPDDYLTVDEAIESDNEVHGSNSLRRFHTNIERMPLSRLRNRIARTER